MPIDAAVWHEVYNAFEELLGPQRAALVMSVIPNIDWTQFATKADLTALEERLELRLEQRLELSEQRLEASFQRSLREAVDNQTKWFVGVVMALIVAMIGANAVLVQTILSRIPLPN